MKYKEFLKEASTSTGLRKIRNRLIPHWEEGRPATKRALWSVYKWARENEKIIDDFFYIVTVKKLHNKLVWFDYSDIENCDSMTEKEILDAKVSVHYDSEEDLCRCQFVQGGVIFEKKYVSGSEIDREDIKELKKIC